MTEWVSLYRGVKPVFSIGDEEEYDTGVVLHFSVYRLLSSGVRRIVEIVSGTSKTQ